MHHEQPAAHVHRVDDLELGAREDEHLGLRRLALEDRVRLDVNAGEQLDVEDRARARRAGKLRVGKRAELLGR